MKIYELRVVFILDDDPNKPRCIKLTDDHDPFVDNMNIIMCKKCGRVLLGFDQFNWEIKLLLDTERENR